MLGDDVHRTPPPFRLHSTLFANAGGRIARIDQLVTGGMRGHFGPPRRSQTSSWATANAPAAVREVTPSLAKMFCTCRATVCSLITSAVAISRLLLPARPGLAPRSSRAVSPCAARVAFRTSASSRARSGAHRGARTRRGPRRARARPSPRPRARGTRSAIRTRTRAASYGAPSSCQSASAGRARQAPLGSPSASATAPAACAASAASTSLPCVAISSNSSHRLSRLLDVAAASRISTQAGRSAARASGRRSR